MKTNGVPSQFNKFVSDAKKTYGQMEVTFGKAQAVRQAVDNGGIGNGVCETISQFCGDKPNLIAQALVNIKDSSIGKFIIKKMFNIQFGKGGDTLELNSEKLDSKDLAKAMGQDGKLGGLLLQLIDGNGWLSNLTSNICNKTSEFFSNAIEKLTDKIPNEDVKKGIRNILSQNESTSEARNRQETKDSQNKVVEEIKGKLKDIKSFEELQEEIGSYKKVRLTDTQKDSIYISWAKLQKNIKKGDAQCLFDNLTMREKRNLKFNDDLTGNARTKSRNKAMMELFNNADDLKKLLEEETVELNNAVDEE